MTTITFTDWYTFDIETGKKSFPLTFSILTAAQENSTHISKCGIIQNLWETWQMSKSKDGELERARKWTRKKESAQERNWPSLVGCFLIMSVIYPPHTDIKTVVKYDVDTTVCRLFSGLFFDWNWACVAVEMGKRWQDAATLETHWEAQSCVAGLKTRILTATDLHTYPVCPASKTSDNKKKILDKNTWILFWCFFLFLFFFLK